MKQMVWGQNIYFILFYYQKPNIHSKDTFSWISFKAKEKTEELMEEIVEYERMWYKRTWQSECPSILMATLTHDIILILNNKIRYQRL